MQVKSYQDLIAWQKAISLVTEIYTITAQFPGHEIYGLTSQLRRASVSIPSSIAEGHGRATRGEFIQFLGHARLAVRGTDPNLYRAKTRVHSSGAGTHCHRHDR
jgi:four helix bundle protein